MPDFNPSGHAQTPAAPSLTTGAGLGNTLPLLPMVRALSPSARISPYDRVFRPQFARHYFYVGRSCVLTLLNVMNLRAAYPGGAAPVERIFDFGCGYGRITRWIRAAWPNARLFVTDYDQVAVDWCVQAFAGEDTAGEIPRDQFDLVWLGSVFTHLPSHLVEPILQNLLLSLRPNGVLVFTTQGRFAIERMREFDWEHDRREWMHYGLDRARFESLVEGYEHTGYGYTDYPGKEDYGVCVARPAWYSDRVLTSSQYLQILFQEKGLDNHQDVSAFLRQDLAVLSRGPLW